LKAHALEPCPARRYPRSALPKDSFCPTRIFAEAKYLKRSQRLVLWLPAEWLFGERQSIGITAVAQCSSIYLDELFQRRASSNSDYDFNISLQLSQVVNRGAK
jgi:hypothetical protein